MTAKCSPSKRPTSSLRRSPRSPIATACSMSCGIPRFVAKQVGGAGRQDRERGVGACERVDAPLHRPVAAPDEEQLGALGESALHLLRDVAALRHLDPERVVDALARQLPPQLGQAAAEGLAGVRDDGDLRHRSTPAPRDPAARLTRTSALSAATPMITPPSDVERMVHAAVHAREGDVDRDEQRDRPDGDPGRRCGRDARRRAARCRRRSRSTRPCVPTGSWRSPASCSSRCTAGRCRWMTSVVAR